jgi:hypothetical protein
MWRAKRFECKAGLGIARSVRDHQRAEAVLQDAEAAMSRANSMEGAQSETHSFAKCRPTADAPTSQS